MAETLMANGGQRFAAGGISNIPRMAAGGVPKYTYDPITGKYTQIDGVTAASSDVPKYTYDPVTQRYTLDTSILETKKEGVADSGSSGGGSEPAAPSPFSQLSNEEQAAYYAANPTMAAITQALQSGFGLTSLGMAQNYFSPDTVNTAMLNAQGFDRGAYQTARDNARSGELGYARGLESYEGLGNFLAEPSGTPGPQGQTSYQSGEGNPAESGGFTNDSGGNEASGSLGFAQGGITGSGNLDLSIPIDIGGGSMGGTGGVSGGSYPFTSIGGQGSNPQQTFGSSNNPQPFIGNNNARSMMPQQGATFLPDPTLDPKIRQFPTDMESVRQSMMKTRGLPPGVMFAGGGIANLGDYSDGGRLLRGPGDGVSDSIPATIANKQPARLADGEFVVPARIVSELGNGSTEAGARKLYQMLARVQNARKKSIGQGRVAVNSRADKMLPA